MASRFLFNEALWHELETRIPKAKRVRAAVAYLGSAATQLLPLRKGDLLVVDMSLRAVRSGVTNPYQVRAYLRRGVKVFTRERLHAKFFIVDNVVIAGSSNISQHARHSLDEAALLTDDAAAVKRAQAIFDQLCTEPIRKHYLAKCIAEYEPPKFPKGHGRGASKSRQAKVWLFGGLRYHDIPAKEKPDAAGVVKQAAHLLHDYERSEVDYTHYAVPMKVFKVLRPGDWIITCVRDGRGWEVWPPARFLKVDSYPRGSGRRRYVLLYELPTGAKAIRWSRFQRAAPSSIAVAHKPPNRTRPIPSDAEGDAILRMWNPRGRFR